MADQPTKSNVELKEELVNLTRSLRTAEAQKKRDASLHCENIKDVRADIADVMDQLDDNSDT